MKKHGKKYRAAAEKIDATRKYNLDEAVKTLKEVAFAKFDETVELTIWLGVDPRKADQLVRGTLVLPHGLGKSKTVLVIAQGDKIREAEEAGADLVCRLLLEKKNSAASGGVRRRTFSSTCWPRLSQRMKA